jgi:hypothetical protein
MNKIALCVLTRNYNIKWIDFLSNFKNHDVFLVIDDNSKIYDEIIENVNIVQVPDEVCISTNYYKSSCWSNLKDIVSWDRALYYFNRVKTDYQHVWFLEDDVFIMSEKVIDKINEKYTDSDLLCAFHEINQNGDIHHGWNHWVNVIHRIGTPWAHSLISASRLSRRLLEKVDNYVSDRHLMFIEALFNTLSLHYNFKVDNPDELKDTITYDKKWNRDDIDELKVYHPFKNIEDHLYIRNKYTKI